MVRVVDVEIVKADVMIGGAGFPAGCLRLVSPDAADLIGRQRLRTTVAQSQGGDVQLVTVLSKQQKCPRAKDLYVIRMRSHSQYALRFVHPRFTCCGARSDSLARFLVFQRCMNSKPLASAA